jgi:hypothetical protein
MEVPSDGRVLANVTIALPETREIDRMEGLLEAAGATTIGCPLVALVDPPDFAPVDAWLAEFAQVGFDDLILLTGEGLRRLVDRSRARGIFDAVEAALKKARKITRGGKPARVLHQLGLTQVEPIVVERGSAIPASAAASCPKCSIFRVERQKPGRVKRGRNPAVQPDRFHAPPRPGVPSPAPHASRMQTPTGPQIEGPDSGT